MSLRRIVKCLGVCAALLAGSGVAGTMPRAEAQHQWQAVTLQPLPGDTTTFVTDVNRYEYSVGSSGGTPVVWNPNGIPTALPMVEGWDLATAYGINDWGLIVGTGEWPDSSMDAVAWLYGTIIPVVDDGQAMGVNENGDIVGCANVHPFFAHLGGTPQILPTNDNNLDIGCAFSVTDWGAIGGSWTKNWSSGPPSAAYPVGRFWYQGQAHDFVGTPHHVTEVSDVISSGFATIRISTAPGAQATHSALAAPGGQYSVLEPLAPGSVATGLNKYGIVVGTRGHGGFGEPVLWAYGTTVPLTDLLGSTGDALVSQSNPVAINDNHVIVGNKFGGASWLIRQGLPHAG